MKEIRYTLPKFGKQEIEAVNELLNFPETFLTEKNSKECRKFLENYYQTTILPTHSCTAALEMSALLLNLEPGDEVIFPSYTFVSTANAFSLFGVKPVFVDIQAHTLNIDPNQIEAAITTKTKAIVVMHYAAISCEMDKINAIATHYKLPIIEDAAQCIGATYQNKKLGTLGSMGSLSFHHTKNITSGLGGALILNNQDLVQRAKIIWQKGTNREAFLEGQVDKYTWQDLGSSYTMNEIGAALLNGQLQRLEEITQSRLMLWNKYHHSLIDLENDGFKRPTVPDGCVHNAHIYYLIAPTLTMAQKLRHNLSKSGITAPFHYVPLHLSPAGKKFSGDVKLLPVCEDIYQKIVRFPIWEGMESNFDYVIEKIFDGISRIKKEG